MSTTVFRVEKNREYVVMSNKFLRNKDMSLKAKGLLALCLSLPEDWNYSLNGLVAICKESITAIRSTLKELEKFNHLKRVKKKDEKGKFIYEYVIYEVPYETDPHIENLHVDNLYTESQHVENVIQQSIEKESIKEQSINNDIYIYNEHENIIKEAVSDKDIQQLLREYVDMRKSINAPLSARGLKMLITRSVNLSNENTKIQKLMLENAIINQWKNVYRPKDEEIEARLNAEITDMKSFLGLS